ncbi:MAG TPA: hypothetical protein DCQ50_21215, partial [Chryseobacterium sp.]|nr:hypothetical protein [Chryseobacterium sp.]
MKFASRSLKIDLIKFKLAYLNSELRKTLPDGNRYILPEMRQQKKNLRTFLNLIFFSAKIIFISIILRRQRQMKFAARSLKIDLI